MEIVIQPNIDGNNDWSLKHDFQFPFLQNMIQRFIPTKQYFSFSYNTFSLYKKNWSPTTSTTTTTTKKREKFGLVIDQGKKNGHAAANKYQNPTSTCSADLIRLRGSEKTHNLYRN